MKKVWVYKRKNTKGWWISWYESGKRKARVLPTKALAEHDRRIKYTQLNSDVFTGTVNIDWSQMGEEHGIASYSCPNYSGTQEICLRLAP